MIKTGRLYIFNELVANREYLCYRVYRSKSVYDNESVGDIDANEIFLCLEWNPAENEGGVVWKDFFNIKILYKNQVGYLFMTKERIKNLLKEIEE